MARHMLQVFVHDRDEPIWHSKGDFLPCVGYYPNGNMTASPLDTMFDTYAFLPKAAYHRDGDLDDTFAGCRSLDKQTLEQLYGVIFHPQHNLGALNAATAEVKAALGTPDYKTEVYLPIVTPVPATGVFGSVKGRTLDLRKEEDRLAAIEWQVNEQAWLMRKSGFDHIRLAGFYYVTERLPRELDVVIPLLRHLNQYAYSRSYRTHWHTLNHWHAGYYRWKELGFRSCSQQVDHVPSMKGEQPQRDVQEKESLREFAGRIEMYDMDIMLEWHNLTGNNQGWTRFKDYLRGGVLYGYMLRPRILYQLGDGPMEVRGVACGQTCSRHPADSQADKERSQTDVPVMRSLYRELYLFLKGALTEKAIFWG